MLLQWAWRDSSHVTVLGGQGYDRARTPFLVNQTFFAGREAGNRVGKAVQCQCSPACSSLYCTCWTACMLRPNSLQLAQAVSGQCDMLDDGLSRKPYLDRPPRDLYAE